MAHVEKGQWERLEGIDRETLCRLVFLFGTFCCTIKEKAGGKRAMKRETTPAKVTDRILELCSRVVPGAEPVYVPVEAAGWSRKHECFPNVQRMVQEHGGQQVNGWAIWQWVNILVEAEAHSVWQNPARKLVDITPHDYGEKQILFLRDDGIVYSGKVIGSIRLPLTDSPLVAEYIGLMNKRDRIMCASSDKTYAIPKEMYIKIRQIQGILHTEVGRNDPCPCQSGLKYKKCCGR